MGYSFLGLALQGKPILHPRAHVSSWTSPGRKNPRDPGASLSKGRGFKIQAMHLDQSWQEHDPRDLKPRPQRAWFQDPH